MGSLNGGMILRFRLRFYRLDTTAIRGVIEHPSIESCNNAEIPAAPVLSQ
jgi:hypothetical protein